MCDGALAAAVGMQNRAASDAKCTYHHWLFWVICRSGAVLLRSGRDSFIKVFQLRLLHLEFYVAIILPVKNHKKLKKIKKIMWKGGKNIYSSFIPT